MPVTSTNLIQGPATLYYDILGTPEPATIDTPPAAGWVDVGGTKGGVELTIDDEYEVLPVDGIIYEVARVRVGRVLTVKTNLAEATLWNIALMINSNLISTPHYEAEDGRGVFRPAYMALLIDGIAPGGSRRRIILRKVLQTEALTFAYKKDEQTVLPVTFTAHWVSPTIRPFVITDASA